MSGPDPHVKGRILGKGMTHRPTYIHTNLYRANNRENESEALAQDD